MDEIDGAVKSSYGNYLIYDQGNSLIDRGQSQITRLIGCRLDLASTEEEDTSALVEATSITWRFPLANTMINAIEYTGSEDYGEIVITSPTEIQNQIKKYGCPVFKYTIAPNYSPTKGNNFIECSVLKDGITYHAVKELTFGQSSTAGTEWTFVIDFDKNINAVLTNTNNSYGLTARLYDSTGQEIDISEKKITWGFLDPSNSSKLVKDSTTTIGMQLSNSTSNKQILTTGTNLNINSLFIVSATLEDWGDYKLTAYLPIPIRASTDYLYLSGATSIIYLTDGAPIYYNKFYELHTTTQNLMNQVRWELYYKPGTLDSVKIYFPDVASQKDINKNIIGYKLKPVSMYVKELPIVSVQCKDSSGNVLWNQPLLIIQNRYPSAMVNQWNGKELKIKDDPNDKSAILANMVGAGKKEDDNSFTGVLMGDWTSDSTTSSLLNNKVGLYGFQKGEMSFSFSEDGKATIGKASGSQLIFDGTNSTITSGTYKKGTGMLLDFDNNQILAKVNNKNIFQLDDSSPYLQIQNSLGNTLLYVGDDSYYLKSKNYTKGGSNAKGNGTYLNLKDGSLEIGSGSFNDEIYLYRVYNAYRYDSASDSIVSSVKEKVKMSLNGVLDRFEQGLAYANQGIAKANSALVQANSAIKRLDFVVDSQGRLLGQVATAATQAATASSKLNEYFDLGTGGAYMHYGGSGKVYATKTNAGIQSSSAHVYVSGSSLHFTGVTHVSGVSAFPFASDSDISSLQSQINSLSSRVSKLESAG